MSTSPDAPAPVQKKQRFQPIAQAGNGGTTSAKTSYLDRLPLELLATIFSYARSPKDVLSVARCNKQLRATLLSKGNAWIWRRARNDCIAGRIPDPPEGWSEARLAAFIFDGGKCEICGKYTKRMYTSFSLRVRLCGLPSCLGNFKKSSTLCLQNSNAAMKHISTWLPTLDTPELLNNAYLFGQNICRQSEMLWAVDEYNKLVLTDEGIADYTQRHQAQVRRLYPYLTLCKQLVNWRKSWEALYTLVKRENTKFTKARALEAGWSLEDLKDTPTFGSMFKSETNSCEYLQLKDYSVVLPKIRVEIEELVTKRTRRLKERGDQQRREDIAAHYQRMRCRYLTYKSQGIFLPTLSEFRRLPIIALLQQKETPDGKGIRSELHESSIVDLLLQDLRKWTENTKSELAKVLGYPNWNNPSSKVLHPVERLTARFLCKRCNHLPSKYISEGSFDFMGACQHECRGLKQNKGKKTLAWSVDQFVPDQKGIDAITRALALLKLDAAIQTEVTEPNLLRHLFQCKSCVTPVVMDFYRLVGHTKRHESMEIALLMREDENAVLTHSYVRGSFARWSGRTMEAQKACSTRAFVCRHCDAKTAPVLLQARAGIAGDTSVETDGATSGDGQATLAKADVPTKTLLTWNGLISHVKAKHAIHHMGDEDFYRDPTAPGAAL